MERLAIVGFGCAGYHALEAIRQAGCRAPVDIYSDTGLPPYNPMLTTYYTAGRLPYQGLFPFGTLEEIARRFDARVLTQTPVQAVRARDHQVVTADGRRETYDQILLSTGASAFVPGSFAGLKGAFCMRTVADAVRLREALEKRTYRRAVIVGASMVGIKVAELLHQRGCHVTLADMAPHIFALAAYPEVSTLIEGRLRAMGIDLVFGQAIAGAEEHTDEQGAVQGYTVSLADGSTFQVPRYTGIGLTFDVPGVSLPYGQTAKIQCIVTGIDNPTADDLYLITVPDGWKASISVNLILTVTAPADITSGAATGEILVMLDNKKGSTTIGRITVFCGTELTIGNLQPGQLATLIGSRIDLKSITVTSGEINDDDWEAIKRNKDMLTDLDLAGTTYTGDDAAKFAYTGHMGDNSTLQTIKLPQGITYIGYFAFNHCSSLTSIDFPVALNTIGNYAFFGCSLLKSIEIPSGVTGIGAGAFGDCSSLSTATFLGETPPVHIGHVFYQCTALSDIYVPAGSVDAYKETWFEYADKIKAIEP